MNVLAFVVSSLLSAFIVNFIDVVFVLVLVLVVVVLVREVAK